MRQLLLVHLLGCMAVAWATSLLNFLIQQRCWHQLPCKAPRTFWLTALCANYALSQSIFNYEPKILNPCSLQGSSFEPQSWKVCHCHFYSLLAQWRAPVECCCGDSRHVTAEALQCSRPKRQHLCQSPKVPNTYSLTRPVLFPGLLNP